MSQDEFAKVLEQLAGQTQYIYYHLMGEPLSHPELPAFLKMAADRGFHSVITTNGTLLHQRGDALIAAGVHKVSISLHSFEAGGEEAHGRYLAQVMAFAEKAAQAGTLVSLRLWNKGCDDGRNERTESLLRAGLPGEWTENSRGYRIRDRVFLEWGERFQWPDLEAPVQGERIACYGLRDQFGILCDGTVVPCCLDSEGVINLGNLFREELSDILASDRAEAIRKGFACRKAAEELCRRCGYARRFA